MDDVVSVIHNGETISDYPEDQPYPSRLLLGKNNNIPIHVVIAYNEIDNSCYVITAYIPSTVLWHTDFKTRKL